MMKGGNAKSAKGWIEVSKNNIYPPISANLHKSFFVPAGHASSVNYRRIKAMKDEGNRIKYGRFYEMMRQLRKWLERHS
jgi:hypothetical protein